MTERSEPRAAKVPDDYRERAERCELAIGFEGGGVEEVDLDGRWLLIGNQVALLDMLDEEDAEDLKNQPGVWATEFDSPEAREAYLIERYGRGLFRWRVRQCRMHQAPQVGRTYPVRLGDDYGVVADVEYDEAAWVAVTLTSRFQPQPTLPGLGEPASEGEAIRTRLTRDQFFAAVKAEKDR